LPRRFRDGGPTTTEIAREKENLMTLIASLLGQVTRESDGFSSALLIVELIVLVIFLAGLWRIFVKAGKPGWAALIPIYNVLVLLEIVGRPIWWIILLLIPIVNIIVSIVLTSDLAKVFGKGIGFTIGLIFLPFIFYPVLGFGDAKYGGAARAQ
jgi:hypothetical protein